TARIDPTPPHAALASRISTNREEVTRELSALTRRGLLRKDGAHALVVTDVRALEALVTGVRGD
ncbi:cyclic nucleotide-binding protein, partial [Acidovorax delafieldii 2AN]